MERTEKGTIFRNEVKERQEQRIDAAKRDKLLEQEMNKVRDYASDLVGDLCACTRRVGVWRANLV